MARVLPITLAPHALFESRTHTLTPPTYPHTHTHVTTMASEMQKGTFAVKVGLAQVRPPPSPPRGTVFIGKTLSRVFFFPLAISMSLARTGKKRRDFGCDGDTRGRPDVLTTYPSARFGRRPPPLDVHVIGKQCRRISSHEEWRGV